MNEAKALEAREKFLGKDLPSVNWFFIILGEFLISLFHSHKSVIVIA